MSKARALLSQLGSEFRECGVEQLALRICPLCSNSNWKFFMCGEGDKDGLWSCKICGAEGNLYQLKERLGILSNSTVVSMQDQARAIQQPDAIPDIASSHWRLTQDPSCGHVLDYLVADRGISMAVIERYKLGVDVAKDGTHWLVYPYLDNKGACVFVKYRSTPPAAKEFRSIRGRECPLFNGSALKTGLSELLLVEGEIDCLTLLSQGVENVAGVPGAAMKKAVWIDKLDQIAPGVIYLIYDSDKVGQQAAHDIAVRIGIERVKSVLLPEFQTVDGNTGKDINEWFKVGHTLEELEELKQAAKPFDVEGVQSLSEVLQQLHDQFSEQGSAPTLTTQWPSLNKKVGGFEYGDLVGIMAEGKVGKSTLAMNLCDHFALIGLGSFFYCNEMPPKRVVRKWVAYKTQIDDDKLTPQSVMDAMSLVNTYTGDLLFGYTKMSGKPIDDVISTIRQAVRRYGVKVVCFDNLHLLVRSVEHSVQEISNMTKRFKDLAMELNILMLLIIQPKRVAEGKIVSAHDANGSSAIEKDCDTMVCLHRNRVGVVKESEFDGIMETEENMEPFMLVRADLTRYAAGGSCTLYIDGSKSTVREMNPTDSTRPTTLVGGGLIPIAS